MIFFIYSLIFIIGFYSARSNAVIPAISDKYHLYFLANYNQLENQSAKAQHYYDLLFKHHKNPHMYPGFLNHLAQTHQYDAIIKLIPTIEASQKSDFQTEMVFIAAYEATGNHTEVTKRLAHLNKQYPENPEIVFFTASAYAEKNNFTQALSCIDAYLALVPNAPKNFLFYFLKAQIYSRAGNQEQALHNVKKSLELFPKFEQGWLLLGLIHELSGNIDEALKNYQTSLKIIGPNPLLEHQIMLLQIKRQQLVHQDTNKFFVDALKAYDNKEYQKALEIVQQSPLYLSHAPSRLLSIELLCKLNNANKALALLADWIKADPTNDTWYRALHLLYKAGIPSNVIIPIFSRIEKENSSLNLPLLYIADIYLREHDTNNAITSLTKALAKTEQPMVRTKIFFQLGLLYYETKKWDEMHNALVQGKNLNQNFPPLLNLLAYYYATKGNNLNEAEHLIRTALNYDKNPHFLDTYALILFKKNNLDEAHKIWTTISKQAPHDSTILYHLAKTLHKKGFNDHATTTLAQAIHYCSLADEKNKYQKCMQEWNKR